MFSGRICKSFDSLADVNALCQRPEHADIGTYFLEKKSQRLFHRVTRFPRNAPNGLLALAGDQRGRTADGVRLSNIEDRFVQSLWKARRGRAAWDRKVGHAGFGSWPCQNTLGMPALAAETRCLSGHDRGHQWLDPDNIHDRL